MSWILKIKMFDVKFTFFFSYSNNAKLPLSLMIHPGWFSLLLVTEKKN